MISRKLKHPPLIEHVFEARWRHPDGREALYDEYELGLGRLYDRIKADLPHRQRTSGHMPRGAFTALPVENLIFDRFVPTPTEDRLSYPLLQYGPGVASYNVDKQSYDWASVKAKVVELFGTVSEVHRNLPSRVSAISLRAIDFFQTDDPAAFLRNQLKVTVETELDALGHLAGATQTPRFQGTWVLDKQQTQLRVAIGPGSVGDQNGLMLDITAQSLGGALLDRGIEDLITYQHMLTGDAFFALLKEKLHNELGHDT